MRSHKADIAFDIYRNKNDFVVIYLIGIFKYNTIQRAGGLIRI